MQSAHSSFPRHCCFHRIFFAALAILSFPPSSQKCLGEIPKPDAQPFCWWAVPQWFFHKQTHSPTIIRKEMKQQIQLICLKVWEYQVKRVTETATGDQTGAPQGPYPTSSKVANSSWEKAVKSYLIHCFPHTVIPCVDTFLVKEV